jgi:type VI secretion system protein ImpH
MANQAHHSILARLSSQPGAFDFFQAVRVLERRASALGRTAVGHDQAPEREAVFLRAQPGLRFASAPLARAHGLDGNAVAGPPPDLFVNFMGLTGPDGILPQHYTSLILSRLRAKDTTLRDWLDQFHHRVLSLFMRAWEKTRWPAAVERHRVEAHPGHDPLTGGAFALAGFGTGGLLGRLRAPDDTIVFYAGLLARQPRTAGGLQQVLAEFFGKPVVVEQLKGHWLYLDADNKAELPIAGGLGKNTALGLDVVVGRRVWDVQSKVRLIIGPLDYEMFRGLLPGGDARGPLFDLARLYLGMELDADVQIVLGPDEVPWSSLDYNEATGPRLGWNTWVRSHNFGAPVGDAVFPAE